MVFGLDWKWAPWRLPLQRRLQTGAVLFYTFLFTFAPILFSLTLIILIFTPLAPLALAYVAWIYYDIAVKQTSSRGGRRWEACRRWRIWKYFANYFPITLEKTAHLDPSKNYLFGYHPHGIMGCGAFANFGSEATGFSSIFPGIRPHLLTLKANYRYPLIRALLLWAGVCDVSRESIDWILTKQGTGNAAIIVVGGAEEALEARPGKYEITLSSRKGFVKMAIKTGACLVPVFCFGENDLFCQAENPVGSTLRNFQEKFKSVFGFSPPLFYGRGIFNYTFGLLPFRKPIHTIVGQPFDVELNPSPDDALLTKVHERYMSELSKLFEEHKMKFGVDKDTTLHFT